MSGRSRCPVPIFLTTPTATSPCTRDGMPGQGAVVEAIRRHREATSRLDQRMWWIGLIGVVLALVGVGLAAVQVSAAFK